MDSVSVVIPAYNPRPEWLTEAIESATSQEPAPLEVLVVDDGSDVPVAYDHPLVRVIRQDNAGVSAARNRGIREACGDLVAFLDADDVWLPGKLAAQASVMADPDVGLCGCDFLALDPDGATRPGWSSPGEDYRQLLRGNRIHTSCAVARRGLLDAVGGFDERLTHSEDWGTWLDIARLSRLGHVDHPLVLYRVHDAGASRDYRRMWRGAIQVLWQHRAARPLAGARRVGQIYGAQAFDAFRATRRPTHLVWAFSLWPGYVIGEAARQMHRRISQLL